MTIFHCFHNIKNIFQILIKLNNNSLTQTKIKIHKFYIAKHKLMKKLNIQIH